MLLHLRKGETYRTEEGHEVQTGVVGPRGGEKWDTYGGAEGTKLSLQEAQNRAHALELRSGGRYLVRIVKTVLVSEVIPLKYDPEDS